MMDDLIAKLRARGEVLSAELKKVEDAIERVEATVAEAAALLPKVDVSNAEEASARQAVARETQSHSDTKPDTAAQRRLRGPKGSSPEEIAEAADMIVRERGTPMTRFELLQPIEELGLVVGGFDKPRNLGTILWRSGRFDSTGDGYFPKEGARDSTPVAEAAQTEPNPQWEDDEL